MVKGIRLVFCKRPFRYIFKKKSYSWYRFKNPITYPVSRQKGRLIDFGMFTFGYRYQEEKR